MLKAQFKDKQHTMREQMREMVKDIQQLQTEKESLEK